MGESVREFSGREFSAEDMSLIIETTRMYPKLSQSELALTVCELLGWLAPSGRAKHVQCVYFLRQLQREGLIRLPAARKKRPPQARDMHNAPSNHPVVMEQDQRTVTSCTTIELLIARPGDTLVRWRGYVGEHHELGDPKVYGSQMRYIITSDSQDLGCMLFSASSWALAPREEWIGWTPEEKRRRLHLVVNNSRLLILPWVRVSNLASRALSKAARQIQRDWLSEYCYAPVLLETFVDTSKHKGTCYKASNWVYLGETQGRGRNDRDRGSALTRKAIYVLPLQRDFRAVLKGEKPYKVVDAEGV